MESGWVREPLRHLLVHLQTGPFGSSLHQSDYVAGGTPVINPASIVDGRIVPSLKMAVGADTVTRLASFKLREGDIVLARRGEMGRCAVVTSVETGWLCGTGSLILRFPPTIVPKFMALLLGSPGVRTYLGGSAVGSTMQNLNQSILMNLLVNLPPVPEQHRIVAKVNELMALCDHLAATNREREVRRDALRTTSLRNLVGPAASRENAQFFLRHSSRVITTPSHVGDVRRTILDLAVRGALVPQDPADGHGSRLLELIASDRETTAARRAVFFTAPEEPLPHIPPTWAWAAIDEIAACEANAITDGPFGANLKSAHYIGQAGYRVIRLENIGHGTFRAEFHSYIAQDHWERFPKHHVFEGDLVVAGLVDPSVRACEVPAGIGPALVKADCYRFHVHPGFASRFALHYLNSPTCQGLAAVHHHGMTLTRLGLGNFRRLPIPVPPLAEQHRIVAKVDALMAICDELEQSLALEQTARGRLLEALLHEALAGGVVPVAV